MFTLKRIFWSAVALFALLMILLSSGPVMSAAPPVPWIARVTRADAIHDGDTLTVVRGKETIKIRLGAVDCPELKQETYQPCANGQPPRVYFRGAEALGFAIGLLFGREIIIEPKGLDSRGKRTMALVTIINACELKHLHKELLRAGWAWHYRAYSKDLALQALEDEARAARRGLWADPNPVPPWEWRKSRKAKGE